MPRRRLLNGRQGQLKFLVRERPIPEEETADRSIEGLEARVINRVAFLPDAKFGSVRLRVDGELSRRHGLRLIDEKLGDDLTRARTESASDNHPFTNSEFGTSDLGIIHVEAAEGESIAGAPPDRIIIVEAAPEAFIFCTITKIAEKRIHVLEATLGLDGWPQHRDPSTPVATHQAIKGFLIVTHELLRCKAHALRGILRGGRQAGARDFAALILSDKITHLGRTGLVDPFGHAALRIHRQAHPGIEVHE